ncbi:Clock-controlled protein 6 [Colletotrichum siamense]|nr:Clock-controlled protein 6 [Colletotrichum siamense]
MTSTMGSLLVGLVLGAAQVANGSPMADAVYVTQVVNALTTYCPGPTVITHGPKTYTIKEATTFTITDCPCTITHMGPVPTGAPSSECATNCGNAYNTCRGAPDANRASCAAEYAGCLGYSPFGPDGSLITPTACSAQISATPVPLPSPIEVAPCPAACAASYDKCRGAPDANRASCAAEYAGCLGYSPFGPDGSLVTPTACSGAATTPAPAPTVPAGAECPAACAVSYDKCRGAPDANRASCAAEYAGCLGYSPFGPDGSLVTPTACSAAATTPAPAPTGAAPTAPAGNECAQKCAMVYDQCRSDPNANRSTCAANYAGCLGYSPFGPDGSLVSPTACSASATGAAQPTGTGMALPSHVVVAGAERVSFVNAATALGACGLAALALL